MKLTYQCTNDLIYLDLHKLFEQIKYESNFMRILLLAEKADSTYKPSGHTVCIPLGISTFEKGGISTFNFKWRNKYTCKKKNNNGGINTFKFKWRNKQIKNPTYIPRAAQTV